MKIKLRVRDLKRIRMERGFSQSDLAQTVGITVTTISNYETGVKTPSPRTMKKLCEALGVEFYDIGSIVD